MEKNGDEIHLEKLSKVLGCPAVFISALKGKGIKEAAAKAVEAGQRKGSVPVHRFSKELENILKEIEERLSGVEIPKEQRRFFAIKLFSVPVHRFSKELENILKEIEERLSGVEIPKEQRRFFAIKLFERDNKITENMKVIPSVEDLILLAEKEFDDDGEGIITNERYNYISSVIDSCYKKSGKGLLSTSDKIDRIVTNRWLGLPIFAAVMILVYYVSITTVGGWATDWVNDNLFGDGWSFLGIAEVPGIPVALGSALEAVGCAHWLQGLLVDGIVAGVGAVLGFVPQMLVLFFFLAFLESCGYMARIAFIMDRIFRKFGLSGKSFIPMLIGTGCGVPGIMASRTIESDRDRKMTIITTTFIPCSAKLPIIALISGALFGGAWWVAPSAYFVGMAAIIVSGILLKKTFIPCSAKLPIIALISGALFGGAWWVAPSAYFVGMAAIIVSGILLKKTKIFAGDPAPFVMELPAYHLPTPGNVLRSMWERGWSFIKKAGTIILLSTIFIWFTSNFGFVNGTFGMVDDLSDGLLAAIGRGIAWLFLPLGWGDWKSAVAAITGLVAKENVVGTFGILYGFAEVAENGEEIWTTLAGSMTALAGYSFLVFNLLCAPCFAAMGAIKREMNNIRWFWIAVGYQSVFAYLVSLCIYQFGIFFSGGGFRVGTAVAVFVLTGMLYLLFRPYKESGRVKIKTA